MAITPDVLVSNTLRARAIGVASNAPTSPMPALLTSTSMGPLSSSAAEMLSGLVTSSGSTRRRSIAARCRRAAFAWWRPRSSPGVEVACGLEAVARRAASDQYGVHGGFPLPGVSDGARIATRKPSVYNSQSIFLLRQSRHRPIRSRKSSRSCDRVPCSRRASAARAAGRALHRLRPAKLLHRDRGAVVAVDGQNAITLETGDFVLLPATPASPCRASSR